MNIWKQHRQQVKTTLDVRANLPAQERSAVEFDRAGGEVVFTSCSGCLQMKGWHDMGLIRKIAVMSHLLLGFAFSIFAVDPTISVSAKHRYPWNGKVDVNFKIEGAAGESYAVSSLAKDLTGGTNINMRTMYKANGIAVNTNGESVTPGSYNWIWDAAADLPDGWECDRVVIKVNAE